LLYQGEEGQACWTEMAEMYAKLYHYDPKMVYENCYSADKEENKRSCYLKGVIVISIYTGFDSPQKLISLCRPYDGKDEYMYKTCTSFILSGFMYYSTNYINRAITLCSALDSNRQKWCFKELGDKLKTIIPISIEREKICKDLPAEYKYLCIEQ